MRAAVIMFDETQSENDACYFIPLSLRLKQSPDTPYSPLISIICRDARVKPVEKQAV